MKNYKQRNRKEQLSKWY